MKDIIEQHHSRARTDTKKKLYNSLISKRSRWAKENNCTKEEIEFLIKGYIGTKCVYCRETIDAKNMGLDHIKPVVKGGAKDIKNLTIVCKRCNIRKGSMSRPNFIKFLDFLDSIPEDKNYVLRKMSSRSYY